MSVPANTSGRAAEAVRPGQEAIVSHQISPQHPAVVLRSHYVQLKALLAIAMIAVVGLSAAVAILATNERRSTSVSSAAPSSAAPAGDTRYDGGPEEGTRGLTQSNAAPGVRYDGGPEEGTRGAPSSGTSSNAVQTTRFDGGPEEGTRGPTR